MKELNDALKHTVAVGECLEWTRCFNSDGYPRAAINGNVNGKVHRFVFEQVNGFSPPVVRHSCDNPKCINPAHLLAGDPTSNMVDRSERGRTHKHVSDEEFFAVCKLLDSGLTHVSIAQHLDISPKRVAYIVRRWRVVKFAAS